MRRIIIIVIAAILVVFILTRVACKKKTVNPATRKGKTTGEIKPKTKAQINAEKAKAKKEERARKRELRRRQREERLARRRLYGYGRYGYGYGTYGRYGYGRSRMRRRGYAGYWAGARTGRKSSIALYKLSAIITIDDKNFAIIDGNQYSIGDVISNRKIVDIKNDRIIIDEFGKTRQVKIGESVVPNLVTPKTR